MVSSDSELHVMHASRFEQLVQTVVDYAIYMLDLEGHVVSWNAGAQRIKGYRADEVIGKHFSMFFTPQDCADGKPDWLLERALSTGGAQDEGWRMRKDGTLFWALVALDVIRAPDGEVVGLAKITRDITDRREAALQLDEMRAQLFQSQKLEALGQLTGGMAHDFNNLLTIIIGSARLALNSRDPQRTQRLLEHILDAGERGSQMTQQLLSFARHKALKFGRVKVPELIESTRVLLGQTLPASVELQVLLADNLWDVEVDAGQLQMVLLNLIFNARDAIDGEGLISMQAQNCTLTGRPEGLVGRFVCISISDTGRGIDSKVLPRIFEPFFTTKSFGKGTGLGLSQVYGFAKQSNGAVSVSSEPGKGTCMSVYLPVYTASIDPVPEHGGA
ncbi:Blue-light-activated protein [compost metagenome]|jgi:PAS domain S-box-containing protein|uniref:histidine kinase n=1 Tax=Pseudomonas wadenswilerensis TaxID=1785161 RepID=A0A380SZK5_9PSED|nr:MULTISPECIES: PAS domain-containing hybrid sensor histidine kinase/response regulator [Pseudomonas]MCE5984470.1 PAS domain S-box protein [Pseudomonas sp. LF19]UVM19844.1 PAS domain S-box protein [Pseudomonas wadenswilerensis]SPO66938.1 PAS/PAC sensor signal transduction histidine kinase [Pseudomonas sp. JV241A]SUQ63472.1 Blue-light-activated protein [Pseudomonas wadenswilerensis]